MAIAIKAIGRIELRIQTDVLGEVRMALVKLKK